MSEIKPKIKIRNYQKNHFQKVLNILQNEIAYLDTSDTGTGKTIIALAIAATYKMGIISIAPKTVLSTWTSTANKYGIPLYETITYQSLRGRSNKELNHNLLIRSGNEYIATETIENYAKDGLLIVFDEAHLIKNDNSQLWSAHALINEAQRLSRMGYNIRVAILTATPADKKTNITSILKVLGVVVSEKMYKYNRSSKYYEKLGLQEVIDKCNKYDRDKTFLYTCQPLNKTTIKTICHDLYVNVLKPYISSGMPKAPTNVEKDKKNLFAKMSKEDVKRIRMGAMLFKSATNYRFQTGEVEYNTINWGDLIKSRMEIDSGKVNTVVRYAKKDLENNPNCKVLIYFTYKRDIKRTLELLKDYNPLKLTGDITKTSDRDIIIDKFQQPNTDYRVIVSNPKVGGTGICLDDIYGDFPRIMYIMPSYFFTEQFQATGRIDRLTTKSKVTIRFLYSKEFPYETGIFNSMAKKSKNSRDMISRQQQNIIYPGEYDSITEQ